MGRGSSRKGKAWPLAWIWSRATPSSFRRLEAICHSSDSPVRFRLHHPYDPEADAFLRAIVNDEEPPVTARDGGNTAIGILAAIEALERGAPVKVPVC